VYKMIPYVATLIVLAFTSRRSQAPRAAGIPYDKGGR
jgi:simple sugar transport system permease protein